MTSQTRIWTPLDFDRDGKQSDCLRLPISTDLSAYGWVPIPVVCIKNGTGLTAVLIAGSHGDEYEGQVALHDLARSIQPAEIRGRIIILPALNSPAVGAGRRVSPMDDGNLNRLYPGRADGSATQMIAHYVSTVLLPMADLVVDLHSGGRSLEYVHCALIRPSKDPGRQKAMHELVRAFGAPFSYVSDGRGGGGATTLSATAETMGVPVLTTELGGGGRLSVRGKSLADAGVRRLLQIVGIRDDGTVPEAPATRMMEVPGREYFVYADFNGLFEPLANLGDEVSAGQLAGLIHSFEHPMKEPHPIRFQVSGMVACRRFPALTARGDCLFGQMRDLETRE
ncbi:succinylglutamate desuccinylase [Aquamicrobium sp. LC103]|nr:succinylglutamate desuccinylase [Aquamicrobium sp. LC103]